MVVAAAVELEDRRRCENEADEQALLKQLLQGNGMEENCGKQKTEKEQYERDEMQEESLQSKAKAAACVVQAQKGEMLEAGREGGVKTHEESVWEVAVVLCGVKVGGGGIRWNMWRRSGGGPTRKIKGI